MPGPIANGTHAVSPPPGTAQAGYEAFFNAVSPHNESEEAFMSRLPNLRAGGPVQDQPQGLQPQPQGQALEQLYRPQPQPNLRAEWEAAREDDDISTESGDWVDLQKEGRAAPADQVDEDGVAVQPLPPGPVGGGGVSGGAPGAQLDNFCAPVEVQPYIPSLLEQGQASGVRARRRTVPSGSGAAGGGSKSSSASPSRPLVQEPARNPQASDQEEAGRSPSAAASAPQPQPVETLDEQVKRMHLGSSGAGSQAPMGTQAGPLSVAPDGCKGMHGDGAARACGHGSALIESGKADSGPLGAVLEGHEAPASVPEPQQPADQLPMPGSGSDLRSSVVMGPLQQHLAVTLPGQCGGSRPSTAVLSARRAGLQGGDDTEMLQELGLVAPGAQEEEPRSSGQEVPGQSASSVPAPGDSTSQVEAFSLDKDFDYDNCKLTPREWPYNRMPPRQVPSGRGA